MGLISQANQLHARTSEPAADKKKTGLLGRIRDNSGYDRIHAVFSRFLGDLQVERAGILYPSEDGNPVLVFAEGFDLTTVKRFAPAPDFLPLRLDDSKSWKTFSGEELDQFRGFFSSRENGSLTALHLREIPCPGEVSCCLVIADSLLDARRTPFDCTRAESILPELSEALKTNCACLASLALFVSVNQSAESMQAHAESALEAGLRATMVRISFSGLFPDLVALQTDPESQSVFSAIVHRIARQTGKSNIIHVNRSFEVQLVLFTALPVDTAMYFFQLMKPLERIFGVQRISLIRCSAAGTGSSVSGIMEFLTGAN